MIIIPMHNMPSVDSIIPDDSFDLSAYSSLFVMSRRRWPKLSDMQ